MAFPAVTFIQGLWNDWQLGGGGWREGASWGSRGPPDPQQPEFLLGRLGAVSGPSFWALQGGFSPSGGNLVSLKSFAKMQSLSAADTAGTAGDVSAASR